MLFIFITLSFHIFVILFIDALIHWCAPFRRHFLLLWFFFFYAFEPLLDADAAIFLFDTPSSSMLPLMLRFITLMSVTLLPFRHWAMAFSACIEDYHERRYFHSLPCWYLCCCCQRRAACFLLFSLRSIFRYFAYTPFTFSLIFAITDAMITFLVFIFWYFFWFSPFHYTFSSIAHFRLLLMLLFAVISMPRHADIAADDSFCCWCWLFILRFADVSMSMPWLIAAFFMLLLLRYAVIMMMRHIYFAAISSITLIRHIFISIIFFLWAIFSLMMPIFSIIFDIFMPFSLMLSMLLIIDAIITLLHCLMFRFFFFHYRFILIFRCWYFQPLFFRLSRFFTCFIFFAISLSPPFAIDVISFISMPLFSLFQSIDIFWCCWCFTLLLLRLPPLRHFSPYCHDTPLMPCHFRYAIISLFAIFADADAMMILPLRCWWYFRHATIIYFSRHAMLMLPDMLAPRYLPKMRRPLGIAADADTLRHYAFADVIDW